MVSTPRSFHGRVDSMATQYYLTGLSVQPRPGCPAAHRLGAHDPLDVSGAKCGGHPGSGNRRASPSSPTTQSHLEHCMTRTMRAVVADGRGGTDIRDLPVPVAQQGWVVVAPVGTGVCGTDLHLIEGDYPHGRFPVVPGHEFAGYITETGPGVTGLSEGAYVGVNPNISCGKCALCRAGATNLCLDILPVGVAINGSCAEFVTVPERIVHGL